MDKAEIAKLPPDMRRSITYSQKYGINLKKYNYILNKQQHRCACCGVHEKELTKRLAVDHDHNTGAIRGLLCSNCNTGIGMLGDSKEAIEAALQYFDKAENPEKYYNPTAVKHFRRWSKLSMKRHKDRNKKKKAA